MVKVIPFKKQWPEPAQLFALLCSVILTQKDDCYVGNPILKGDPVVAFKIKYICTTFEKINCEKVESPLSTKY